MSIKINSEYLKKYGWTESLEWLEESKCFSRFMWKPLTSIMLGYSKNPSFGGWVELTEVRTVVDLNNFFRTFNLSKHPKFPDDIGLEITILTPRDSLDFEFSFHLSDSERDQVWEKGRIVEGFDPKMFRLDAGGAMMSHELFCKTDSYGWVADVINPALPSVLDNLRPLHLMNDISKGTDYPSWLRKVVWDGQNNVVDLKQKCMTIKRRNDKARTEEAG